MGNVRLQLWRRGATKGTSGRAAEKAHKERLSLLRGLEKTVDVQVASWGTSRSKFPGEVAEVGLRVKTGSVPVVAAILKHWIDTEMIEDVRIRAHDGTEVSFRRFSAKEIESMISTVARPRPRSQG